MSSGEILALMRVILRNKKTGLYYAGCDQWIPEASQALDFDEIEHAGQLAFEVGFTELEVVLSYDDPVCQLALPIRPESVWSPSGRRCRLERVVAP